MIDINNLSKYEENNRIEVKRAKGGLPNSIWETYSAFANTDGGIILLGVDENEDQTLVTMGIEDVHKMKTAMAGGVSDPRNETVMKMFSLIDVGERAGSGIPDFMSIWQKHFGTSPVYTITHNPERTLLNISVAASGLSVHRRGETSGPAVHHKEQRSGLSKVDGGLDNSEYVLSGTAKDIVRLMLENPMITYNELSVKLGKARSGIAKQIKKLIDDNIIESKEKNGVWIVKDRLE